MGCKILHDTKALDKANIIISATVDARVKEAQLGDRRIVQPTFVAECWDQVYSQG